MKLRTDLAFFSTLVKSGSLSAAAREFNVTPSAVSKWLAQLEERLGVRLVARNTRRFSLTQEVVVIKCAEKDNIHNTKQDQSTQKHKIDPGMRVSRSVQSREHFPEDGGAQTQTYVQIHPFAIPGGVDEKREIRKKRIGVKRCRPNL